MLTCPVCEHRQMTGDACEVCGHAFGAPKLADLPVEAVPGIERAHWDEPFPEDAAPMPELEGTAAPYVEVEASPMADIENTATGPVSIRLEPPIPDLDRGRTADDGVRVTAPSGPATCRYCKNVQAEGLLCDKCGMRLPRSAPAPKAVRSAVNLEPIRCLRCGERVIPETRCAGCGQLAGGAPDL